MSDFNENIPAAPEHRLDRLIDGELSEADRRNLLIELEHEPDGWRQCALAFLEAQCWKAELGQIAAPAAVPVEAVRPVSDAERELARRRQNWRQRLATALSMAASFLIALVIGMGLRGNGKGTLSYSHDASVETVKDEFPLGARGIGQLPAAAVSPASRSTHSAEQSADPATGNGWEMVTLAGDKSADGRAETIHVPAERRDTLDQAMLEQMPDVIPPELQKAFEQSGHRILQQRELVPVQMNDGRRLVVPVDHVEIHYVGRPSL